MEIPNDENGRILLRLRNDGDDLTQPRNVEFFHIFPDRTAAIRFAEAIPEKEFTVSISYYEERSIWDVTVISYMKPDHANVTKIEKELGQRAEEFEGHTDGWQTQVIKNKV